MYVEFKVPDGIKNDIIQRDANVVSIYTPKLFLQTLKAYPHARNMFFGGYSTATNNTNDRTGTVTNFGCENKGSYQVPPLVIECFYKSALKYIHRTIQGNSIVDSKNPPVEFEMDEYFNGAVPPLVYLVSNRSWYWKTSSIDVYKFLFRSFEVKIVVGYRRLYEYVPSVYGQHVICNKTESSKS